MSPDKKMKEPPVYALSKPSRCYSCDRKLLENELVQLKDSEHEREVLCSNCAGLEHFTILPKGDAGLTRLCKKYSQSYYVVLKWSEIWKCYERQGLLVEKSALQKAKDES